MSLAVRPAGTGLLASDAPSNAVRLARVCRQLLRSLVSDFQGPKSPCAAFRRVDVTGTSQTPESPVGESVGASQLSVPVATFRGSAQSTNALSAFDQSRESFGRHDMANATPGLTAGSPAVHLVTTPMGETNVVGSVQPTLPTGNRPAVSGRSPRAVTRFLAAVEVTAAFGAGALRHLAGEFGDMTRLDGLDEHRYSVVGRSSVVTQSPQFLNQNIATHFLDVSRDRGVLWPR